MKKKKLTVTVGIPAYNEELNIEKLLKSILKQKQTKFLLQKVIVVSDKSTDTTEQLVKSFRSKKVQLIINEKRLGQALSQNKITKACKSSILVLMNADMTIYDENFINKLISTFSSGNNVGIVCPTLAPLKASTYFEKVVNYSVEFKQYVFAQINNGNNMYTCRGACRAFSKKFYKNFTWPKLTAEDTYTYLYAVKKKFEYKLCKNAVIYYRSPDNFKDHMRQSRRFTSHKQDLIKFFGQSLVKEEYTIPAKVLAFSLFHHFKRPLEMCSYICITLLTRLLPFEPDGPIWEPSSSTKKL